MLLTDRREFRMISSHAFHCVKLNIKLMTRPQFGYQNVIMNRSNSICGKHIFLTTQRYPLQV